MLAIELVFAIVIRDSHRMARLTLGRGVIGHGVRVSRREEAKKHISSLTRTTRRCSSIMMKKVSRTG